MKNVVEKTILKKLKNLTTKKNNAHFLLAVSGGADSIAMLKAISECNYQLKAKLSVITVNHNIREEKETAGDAEFVLNFCSALTSPIQCHIIELKKNEVYETAKLRKNGIEEAARFLRYKAFKKKAKEVNADYILTAHNKNDYYETMLMRIFQGAEPETISGIKEKRDIFFRPMLDISRSEIESYLNSHNIQWREDSTNQDQLFLRNKIRHNLIPTLNIVFDGWQSGLDKTIEKIVDQNNLINYEYKKKINHNWQLLNNDNQIKLKCNFKFFKRLNKVFKLKFIQEGINILNAKSIEGNLTEETNIRKRIPYTVFKDFLKISKANPSIISGEFSMNKKEKTLYFFKTSKNKTNPIFSEYIIWITSIGKITTPAGNFIASSEEDVFYLKLENEEKKLGPFKKPFCIRSKILGDKIKLQNGNTKTIKKIFNEWNLTEEQKAILPIVEEKGVVKAILGNVYGKKNITNYF